MYSSFIFLRLLVSFQFFFDFYAFGDIAVLDANNKSVEFLIDYKITYTPPIPDDGIFGILTTASPPDACSPINPYPGYPSNTSVNWFVLAFRSSSFHTLCSNREKIQHAVNAGYKAIILYSPMDFYQTSVSYTTFEHSNISIPAVLVSHEDGETLRNHFLYKSGYKLFITSEIPPNFTYYLIPFAIVISAVILIIISYLVFQLMMCIMERRKAQRHRLSKKYLKKLTLQKYEKGIYYETCAICLDDYIEGEKIRILPCNHAYHMKCIDPWLTKNRRVCPVCKAKVTLPGMEEYPDSDSDNEHRRPATETTHLLPSSTSVEDRHNEIFRHFRIAHRHVSTTTATNVPHHQSSLRSNQNRSSRYAQEILDDTLFQPGPSTSAPIISELTSNRDSNKRNKRKKKRNSSQQRSNVQVVIADVSTTLIAPPQLSINCDSESERPVTPDTRTQSQEPTIISISSISTHNLIPSTSSRNSQNNRGISVDEIV